MRQRRGMSAERLSGHGRRVIGSLRWRESQRVGRSRPSGPVSGHELLMRMRGCADLKKNQKADAAASAVAKINNR